MKILFFATALFIQNVFSATYDATKTFDDISIRITRAKDENHKVVLFLGATPPERSNVKFPDFDHEPYIVYFDQNMREIFPQNVSAAASLPNSKVDDWTGQFILGDFNDLNILKDMSDKYSSCFDLIIPDCSVSKFMQFKGQHLNYFLNMLTPNGTMVFDYQPSLGTLQIKPGEFIKSDEEVISYCFNLLDPSKEQLVHRPFFKVDTRDEGSIISMPQLRKLSEESLQTLNDIYSQYISEWKNKHMPENCHLNVIENNIFPYWAESKDTARNGWISKKVDYLVLRKN